MAAFTFTPTDAPADLIRVPFIEDAREDFAPGYRTRKSPDALKSEVVTEIIKLGGSGVIFREGFFGSKPRRYGYVVEFQYGGSKARMQVAGLPMRTETPAKKQQVLAQALFNLADWLKAAVTARVFAPGSDVLVQYVLVDGNRTLGEALAEGWKLPVSNPVLQSGAVVDAVIVE